MSQRARWTIVIVLLTPAVVLPLLVGIYARTEPELFGFPFYFWFQFALIPVAAVLTTAAYQLTKHEHPPRSRAEDQTESIR
ncbi:MAG TPA: DUF3311 domain-containing protein [Nocardioides sp.]|uniref:DUF3311 domain-containing protein n=1 Tax=uncultured Nocardioides sp. TaxID=198441 RepID=UPI000ECE3945|nr:DUF3311 domain-containing protein [uncultured Nocardioides sp.]HCB04312.1 hypothetical protein [Nocardioides sp.]HRD60919.1 DUF3311 domain-containing protein [Nocardioides sp.]HRI97293.1 DUF3311 domain-containing protein [Nocardioides sp.]